MTRLAVDLDLVRKYSRPGPRYTSYPTAPHFQACHDPAPLLDLLRGPIDSSADLSLYYHIPFCDTLCWFCACTKMITRRHEEGTAYIHELDREMEIRKPFVHPERRVAQIHFGGGSPTFLLPDDLRRLGAMIRDRFPIKPDVEMGVEIDPRELDREHIRALRAIGCNRASVGVQDNDDRIQKAVNRIQPKALTEKVVGWIREEGFPSLNIDLVYGLPFQTPQSFEGTLDDVLALAPDRFAIFNFAYVPWVMPAQKLIKEADLPSPETRLEILKMTIEKLTSSGYDYIGMDHFARHGDELSVAHRNGTLQRNFQGYSTTAGADIHGFGMSSISQSDRVYVQNIKELGAWRDAVTRGTLPVEKGCVLTDDDRIRRHTIMRLMCSLRLDYAALSRDLGVDFASYFAGEISGLADMEADGLLHREPDALVLTDAGRLLIRNIAMRFDAYLKDDDSRYSKTV